MKNKYLQHSHIEERTFKHILHLFCMDIEAQKVSEMTGVSRTSINRLYGLFRERMAEICASEKAFSEGEYELDESYFGARRVRGIRGRGAKGKTIVFGILKRGGNVFTAVVKDCKRETLFPIIKDVIPLNSTIYTDGFSVYESLMAEGYAAHFSVCHGENEFSRSGGIHTNGIENFWGLCKSRLAKFRGIDKNNFSTHIKECEFRFNHRHENIFNILIRNFRINPLNLS